MHARIRFRQLQVFICSHSSRARRYRRQQFAFLTATKPTSPSIRQCAFWGAVKVEYTAVPYKVADVAWTPEQLGELNFYRLLYNESDRGCVLVAAAYLDKQLAEVLQARMIDDSGVQKFFESSQPLGSFAARIAIARYLGIISEKVRRALDTIRKIRNDFAHNLEFENSENQSVKARCANLQVCTGSNHINQRDKFIDVATSLNLVLGGHLSNSQR